jgi:hypothetical protein
MRTQCEDEGSDNFEDKPCADILENQSWHKNVCFEAVPQK